MYVNYILKTSSKHTCTFTFTNDTSRGPSCIKYYCNQYQSLDHYQVLVYSISVHHYTIMTFNYKLKQQLIYICTRHSTILYRKSMKFGIQEELLLIFLDTKFH